VTGTDPAVVAVVADVAVVAVVAVATAPVTRDPGIAPEGIAPKFDE
jgi:hypothetical protein